MNAWRFAIREDGTITRGKVYRIGGDGDNWRWYWEDDTMVAFTIHWRGWPEYTSQNDSPDFDRVEHVLKKVREYEQDEDMALKRLAFRLTGNWDADFICVSLDRSYDLYALSWDGDPDHTWRDEIEAVYHGEVYRMEVQRYVPRYADYGHEACWTPDDDMCEEWYGEDSARDAHERAFPMPFAPAEFHLTEVVA